MRSTTFFIKYHNSLPSSSSHNSSWKMCVNGLELGIEIKSLRFVDDFVDVYVGGRAEAEGTEVDIVLYLGFVTQATRFCSTQKKSEKYEKWRFQSIQANTKNYQSLLCVISMNDCGFWDFDRTFVVSVIYGVHARKIILNKRSIKSFNTFRRVLKFQHAQDVSRHPALSHHSTDRFVKS